MKKKTMLLTIVFIVVLVAAYFGYKTLSERYAPGSGPEANENQPMTETTPLENTAADFTVSDRDGNEVRLSDHFGKPIIINFWATWCGPCKSELPAFDKAYQEYGEEIEFLMINLTDGARDTVDGVKTFLADEGYGFPVYFDNELSAAKAYEVYSIPLTILIDANGNVVDKHVGAMSESVLNDYLESLLKQ